MLFCSFPGLPVKAAPKYDGNGICSNGLDGICINIYDYPYTHYAAQSWGEYACGPQGCAWFATSRACEITEFPYINSGYNWYYSMAPKYGLERGQEPRAPAPHEHSYSASVTPLYGAGLHHLYLLLRRKLCGQLCSPPGS